MNPATLPSGTLTFVATDIEGSTGILRDLGPVDYVSVLDDQEDLLASIFATRGGMKVDTCGDSCLFVFTGATNALAASLDAQLALSAHRWPRSAEVRIRMGLHTGDATPIGNRYVTLAVHKVDRIAALAHGRQVMISDITRRLVDADLPTDATLADIGEYPLKGFEAEHVFQLCHPGLSPELRRSRAPKGAHRDLAALVGSIPGRGRNMLRTARSLAAVRALKAGDGRASKARAASGLGALRRHV